MHRQTSLALRDRSGHGRSEVQAGEVLLWLLGGASRARPPTWGYVDGGRPITPVARSTSQKHV